MKRSKTQEEKGIADLAQEIRTAKNIYGPKHEAIYAAECRLNLALVALVAQDAQEVQQQVGQGRKQLASLKPTPAASEAQPPVRGRTPGPTGHQ